MEKEDFFQLRLWNNWIHSGWAPSSKPYTKINSKCITNLNVQGKTLKNLIRKYRHKFQHLGSWWFLRHDTSNQRKTQIKLDFIKIKNFCVSKGTINHRYTMAVHGDVWQKQTQYCKAIILQLKINKFNYFKKRVRGHQPERWKDGNYLAVQWLELHVLTVEGLGSIPGQGSHKLHGMTKKFLKREKRETDLWTLWGKEGKGWIERVALK